MSWVDSDYEEPVFYITLMHCTTVVSVSVSILAAYCIIYKTPRLMSSYSRVLLNHLFWASLLELLFNSGSTPVVFSPYAAGYPSGFLNIIGISTHIQTCIGFTIVGFECVTFVQIYMHRYVSLKRPQKYDRKLYLAAATSFYASILLVVGVMSNILAPDPVLSRQFANATFEYKIPMDDERVIIYRFQDNTALIINGYLIAFMAMCGCLIVATMAGGSFYELKKQATHISAQTAKMQMSFLLAVCAQTFVALFVLIIPGSFIVYSVILRIRSEALMNASFYFLSLNGTADTACLLTLNKPYRMAVKKIFGTIYYRMLCRKAPVVSTPFSISTTSITQPRISVSSVSLGHRFRRS